MNPQRSDLTPPPDLYDGVYSDSLAGEWMHTRVLGLVVVVEGPGDRPGTVAVHAQRHPVNRQKDLPITTLHAHYRKFA